MPIEIKELHIKVNVGEDQQSGAPAAPASGEESKDAIVKACVEKVLEILKERQER
jgi:hypothetical protein